MITINHRQLVIRADGGGRTGAGHLMRCLSLAQAWRRIGGEASFLSHCSSTLLRNRIKHEGFHLEVIEKPFPHPEDLAQTQNFLACRGFFSDKHTSLNWMTIDGYHFDSSYHDALKERAIKLLVIDDMAHLKRYNANVILNQNLGSEQLHYSYDANSQLLLGPKYALLREEFWKWKDWKRKTPEVTRKILVTMGGSDPDNVTMKIIDAIQGLDEPELEIKVVVGPANQQACQIEEIARRAPCSICCVNQPNMPELMAWADLAVSGAGSTCWELAFMGLPNVILILAENQREVAERLDTLGVSLNLGVHTEISDHKFIRALKDIIRDPAGRKAISEKGKRLVDGMGAKRVAISMNISDAQDDLQVRPARWEDAELLWQWANDPIVRANSFCPEPIPLSEHIEWYKKKLNSPNTRIWILERDKMPVAQMRYDRVDMDTAEIDFSVESGYRGRGIGTRALLLTSDVACKELGVSRLKGVVFSSNEASVSAFTKAGFECISEEKFPDTLCYVLVHKYSETNGDV